MQKSQGPKSTARRRPLRVLSGNRTPHPPPSGSLHRKPPAAATPSTTAEPALDRLLLARSNLAGLVSQTAPAPAPEPVSADQGGEDNAKDYKKAPAPAPAMMEVKSGTGADVQPQRQAVDAAEAERREGMSGGKKAGVVVGAFSVATVVGLAAVVYRKQQANIRWSRYADYSARLELI